MEQILLTPQMYLVLGLLAMTVYLFISEIVRVDIAAILIMLLVGISGLVPGEELFNGFASNAVISIIAVMIIGASLDKTGIMQQVAQFIIKVGGKTESRITSVLSSTVAVISSFMQNVGAAALFLPVATRVADKANVPLSRILMPMGFCAILGGTLTMVGSSPLILLNDLILASSENLPEGSEPLQTFDLFAVTPIGIALILTGLLYFLIFGRFILPAKSESTDKADHAKTAKQYFKEVYGVGEIFELRIPSSSPFMGKKLGNIYELEEERPVIIGFHDRHILIRLAPSRSIVIEEGARIAVQGQKSIVHKFAKKYGLEIQPQLEVFSEALSSSQSGVREIIVPPTANFIGKNFREIGIIDNAEISVLRFFRGGERIEKMAIGNMPLQAGDTLLVHGAWKALSRLKKQTDFVMAGEVRYEQVNTDKIPHALIFFAITLSLILFSDFKLSLSLMVGAIGMILAGVIKIEDAYKAVDWKTIFLLASLIPLGVAVDRTGTAAWIAQSVINILGDVHIIVYQLALAILATIFTLVMSNVGATVLLVPLAINIAIATGGNPLVFALIVGISTSNSFLLPTHQVNALLMGPGGYKVKDFMKAGGIMTVLFIMVELVVINLFY